ncbi:hypothetical protein FOCC_FOCC007612, partial [Frankliniella occidentalis]
MSLGEWHEVRVSRTGRLAVLQLDAHAPDEAMAPGAFLQLSLPLSLYLGGVPALHSVAPRLRARTSFVMVNEQPLHLLESALAGVNVDNCPHPCAARPCAPRGRCVPQHDYFTCLCPAGEGASCSASGAASNDLVPAAGDALPSEAPAAEHDPQLLEHRLSAGFSGNGHLHFSDMETVR